MGLDIYVSPRDNPNNGWITQPNHPWNSHEIPTKSHYFLMIAPPWKSLHHIILPIKPVKTTIVDGYTSIN